MAEDSQKRTKRGLFLGSILGLVGFLLSPLSWWNDAFVNIPLAYFGAWVISLFHKPAFAAAFAFFYWVTNILGLFLMHKGFCRALQKGCSTGNYFRKDFIKDMLTALFYTAVIVVMLKFEIIRPIEDYLKK